MRICKKHNCEMIWKEYPSGSQWVCLKCTAEARHKYKQSDKGRQSNRRYKQGKSGREASSRWNASIRGRKCRRRYTASEKGKAALLRYHQTENAKQLSRLNKKLHTNEIAARIAVNHALRDSKLIKSNTCQICGGSPTESHHWSYKKEHWLDVQWLCIRCHKQLHFPIINETTEEQKENHMFNAADAREITNEAVLPDGKIIQPYINLIDGRIKQRALEGKHSLIHPFRKMDKLDYPTPEIKETIRKNMEANGFTWKEHPDPDPGYPGSGPYTEISW